MTAHDPDAPGSSPPELVVRGKAIACELPAKLGLPLSRWSLAELGSHVRGSGLMATVSDITIWRWLNEDAIRPWQHRCWIFPRDPDFEDKAGRILDLYHRVWKGRRLRSDEFVICADEKTSIQARARKHPSLKIQPGRPLRIEHEYSRLGAWAYLAALDVHRFRLCGRCERSNGIASFDRLVAQTMSQRPYRQARRVFWIVDNGTAHRGPAAARRLRARFPTSCSSTAPSMRAGSIRSRSTSPCSSARPSHLMTSHRCRPSQRILAFQRHYQTIARPFEWRFTRKDLAALLRKLDQPLLAA
jgi:hypothetical protein